jgi:UDP-glucose:(heptosyl)LPS alpha-1,3-glucosyltransferase
VHAEWLDIRRATAGTLERLGIALNAYHHYVCGAERRMFADPALRAVICNSGMVRDEIRRRFGVLPEKLHVIYNGVDLALFHPRERAARRAAAREDLGLAAGETLFLFVGSGFARKGLDAAVAALAACGNPAFRLAVVGRDREAARFAAAAGAQGDRVLFLGGREDVHALYAAADCFMLPTRYDPFPNTVLEALAMGLPVIVGRRSGAAEIIEPGSGWKCDPADVPGLARAMQAAVRAAQTTDIAAAARGVAERYGIDDMARKLNALYATLAA